MVESSVTVYPRDTHELEQILFWLSGKLEKTNAVPAECEESVFTHLVRSLPGVPAGSDSNELQEWLVIQMCVPRDHNDSVLTIWDRSSMRHKGVPLDKLNKTQLPTELRIVLVEFKKRGHLDWAQYDQWRQSFIGLDKGDC